MPGTRPHLEKHFTAGNFVRDVVIGMSDGLTVPFALAAGLSGAVQNTRLIVVGGLAEIAAGSIAMGLGGYLAAHGDAEHYEQERAREEREIVEIPEEEKGRSQPRVSRVRDHRRAKRSAGEGAERASQGLGRFHDALRTGTGRTGPQACPDQRGDHRRVLHCGRIYSPVSLYGAVECGERIDHLRCGHTGGAGSFWLHERAFYRHSPASRGVTDNGDRWTCGGSRFYACETDCIVLNLKDLS